MRIRKIEAMTMAIATGVFFLPSCKGNQQQQQQQQAPELAVITVGEEDAKLETSYPAMLEGTNDVEIRPQITGFLTKVNVKEGQRVGKGQVLFVIDQVQLQAAVDQAKAAVAVAQANVNTATTSANNNKILLDKNIISASAYQTSVDALNAAKAQLNQANAALVNARKNLSYTTVTAPAAGIIGAIDFKEGSLVSPQTLLTILSNNSDVDARFSLNEKDLLNLTDGGKRSLQAAINEMPAVTLEMANGVRYQYPGKITSISGVLDAKTGSAVAKATFPNPDGMLRSGNTGKVVFPSVTTNAIMIPQNATYEIQDMKFCYVVGDSSKVHATPIQISAENDGKNYIVTGGLKPGDVVVVEGVGITVKDNMVITPKKGGAPAADAQQAQQAQQK